MNRIPIPGLLRSRSSLCMSAATLASFLVVVWIIPADALTSSVQWVREVVQQYGWVSSNDQRIAHVAALALTVAFSAGAFMLGARFGPDRGMHGRPHLEVVACTLVAIAGFVALAPFVPAWLVGWAAVLSVVLLIMGGAVRRLPAALVDRAALVLIGAYGAVLIVPGLLVRQIPIMEVDPVAFVQFEAHLLWMLLRGSALAAGHNFFGELPMGYGLLMPSIMSVADLRSGGLSIATQLRIVQACQALFVVTAVAAYMAYRRRNYLGVLVALLLAGPYWATAGLGIWHPNQTGFRSLGFPAGMLVLMLAARLRPQAAAWCLGAAAGVALLMNFETAVAVMAGFVVFLAVRTRSLPWALYARSVVAVIVVFVAYLVTYRLALGRLPFNTNAIDIFFMVNRFSGGGFGGRLFVAGHEGSGYYVVPFALLMFAHAVYAVMRGFRALGSGPLPLHLALRTSVAVTLLVWFAYYFNAPNWWQMWTHLFLYGFLVVDVIDRRLFGIGIRRAAAGATGFLRRRVAPAGLVLLFFFSVMVPHTNRHLLKYSVDFMYPLWVPGAREVSVLSGVLLSADKADALARKAARLKQLHAETKGSLVYLTFNMTFMPHLTGLYQAPPFRDVFTEMPGDIAFEEAMQDLARRRPAVILIDAPSGPLALYGARKDYQDRLRRALQDFYWPAGIEEGWQVWRPDMSKPAARR